MYVFVCTVGPIYYGPPQYQPESICAFRFFIDTAAGTLQSSSRNTLSSHDPTLLQEGSPTIPRSFHRRLPRYHIKTMLRFPKTSNTRSFRPSSEQ